MMVALLFALGCIVGSFLNVVIVRTREEGSIVKPRSRCPHCHHALARRDMVPVVSFLLRKGTCRYCQVTISWQYPLVEIATGLLFALLFVHHFGGDQLLSFSAWSSYVRDAVIGSFLILIFVYDARYQLVPDGFVFPAIVIAFGWNVLLGQSVVSLVVGGLVIGGIFWVQYAISRGRWIGAGDIFIGCLLGVYLGLTHGLVAIWVAYVGGAIIALFLLALKKVNPKTPVPLGAYLIVAAFFTVWCGDVVLNKIGYLLR